MYSIFTNINRHNPNKTVPANWNRNRVLHAGTLEEAKQIKSTLEASGYTVTKISTNLGYRVEV